MLVRFTNMIVACTLSVAVVECSYHIHVSSVELRVQHVEECHGKRDEVFSENNVGTG